MLGALEKINKSYGGKNTISAISKKGVRKGRQIEGQDEGWIDMELDDDEDEDNPSKEEDEKPSKNKKKK